MHFHTLTFLGFALALICILQVTPGAQSSKLEVLQQKAKDICKFGPLNDFCIAIVEKVLAVFSSGCVLTGETTGTSTTTTTASPPDGRR